MSAYGESIELATASAFARLEGAGVRPEPLAELVPERRVMLVKRAATMRRLGEVWRLGVLLLTAPATDPATAPLPPLFAAGRTTRSAARPYPGNQSISREERRDIAAAALRGGFSEGSSVHFDATTIPLNEEALRALGPDHPLGVHGDGLRVRWRSGASLESAPTLGAYLDERVELLVHPPEGA